MKNIPLLVGTIMVSALLVIGISVVLSGNRPTSEDVQVSSQLIAGDMRNLKGNPDASITIVEYSDFQCPACQAVLPILDDIIDKYGDDVSLVYRHMPLDSIHPNARQAAFAAESAAKQDKFWQMHDQLFASQQEWSQVSKKDELIDLFVKYAVSLDLDKDQFIADMSSSEVAGLVQEDTTISTVAGITGTPTFFINGQKTTAPQLLTAVESLIEQK